MHKLIGKRIAITVTSLITLLVVVLYKGFYIYQARKEAEFVVNLIRQSLFPASSIGGSPPLTMSSLPAEISTC